MSLIKIRKNPCLPFKYEEVDAVEYFTNKLKNNEAKIEKVKLLEHKSSGTAFVLFDTFSTCEQAIQDFPQF
jgi:hypothetical protein